jgi:hypothetical protein
MKVPGENGEEVWIIAQSQFDVNWEIIEEVDLLGTITKNRMIFLS